MVEPKRRWASARAWLLRLRRAEGAQILEFAVALPLLVVFVVGIFDFGDAFNVKQKLNTAVREGARRGSTLPTGDLTNSGTPDTVRMVRDVVDGFLQKAAINDCALSTSATPGSTPLSWVFVGSGNGCPGTLTLTVERGYAYPTVIATSTFYIICTRVNISYPYRWHFNSVITLLVPGASYAGTSLINTNSVVPNMN